MDRTSPNDIADEWIARWSSAQPNPDSALLDDGLAAEDPALCLASIVEVLRRIQARGRDELMAVLAAGPLEDLLTKSGDEVVDQVASLARRDESFRVLLNGVWCTGMKPHILEKLARYRTQPW